MAKLERSRPAGRVDRPSAEDIALADRLSLRATGIWLAETLGNPVSDEDKAFTASREHGGGAWASEVIARARPVSASAATVTDAAINGWLAEIAARDAAAEAAELSGGSPYSAVDGMAGWDTGTYPFPPYQAVPARRQRLNRIMGTAQRGCSFATASAIRLSAQVCIAGARVKPTASSSSTDDQSPVHW